VPARVAVIMAVSLSECRRPFVVLGVPGT